MVALKCLFCFVADPVLIQRELETFLQMLLRPRLSILEIGHRKEEGKHCSCRKRLFKCPFLLQSTSWLTVRFILDYNTFSNFLIKIWSNFADFIKEESFCRQLSFDFAILYEIKGLFFTSVECDSMYVRCVGSYISMNNV